MCVTKELPKYKCHKEVWALKIKEIKLINDKVTEHMSQYNGAVIVPENEEYDEFEVGQEYMHKHRPQAGGYYVVYSGGYKSFSPAKEFEEGYTLIKSVIIPKVNKSQLKKLSEGINSFGKFEIWLGKIMGRK